MHAHSQIQVEERDLKWAAEDTTTTNNYHQSGMRTTGDFVILLFEFEKCPAENERKEGGREDFQEP